MIGKTQEFQVQTGHQGVNQRNIFFPTMTDLLNAKVVLHANPKNELTLILILSKKTTNETFERPERSGLMCLRL